MVNRNLTRQLFVDYECRSRGKTPAVQRQILREWNGKTAAQKDRLVKCLRLVLDSDTVAEVHQFHAEQKRQFANNHTNTNQTYQGYFDAHSKAIEAQEQHCRAIDEVIAANERLYLEQGLQHGDAQSLAYTFRSIYGAKSLERPRVGPKIEQLEQRMDRMRVPRDAAGIRKMPVIWLSKHRYARKVRERVATATNTSALGIQTPHQGGTWTAWRCFQGGMAVTNLWIQFDANNTVIDSAVRKDAFYDNDWFDVRSWAGQVNNEGNRVPLELACHGEMDKVTSTVVQPYRPLDAQAIQNFVRKTTRSYRLYTAYCEHHDLHEIIQDYSQRGQPIPEPFIWSVAETLMECALVMERGHANERFRGSVANWQEIVHRDLKPGNIFMTAPNPYHFPEYPQARVGDWGLAIRTSRDDPNNPHWYQGPGTPGYRAPEHDGFVSAQTLRPLGGKMLACTNVWGIGIILYCLITTQVDPDQPGWLGDPQDETMYYPANNDKYKFYSQELIEVLMACLTIDESVRAGPAQLLRQIRNTLLRRGQNTHMGMMDGTASEVLQAINALTFTPDQYALGMVQANLPAQHT
ncbi:hypothetical protein M409DRAFT_25966 [Zasmidium cellare ATCC 36951]|uniref:non-specific serine/threonine protein kinase n=1 Tax=Zasmidium cellare ATCC 36951 TaxID=1080233 RepID=A0A6A6C9G9_ZASCE|nr:uncharacterized protein M409DRAFT_25966 [Zasmidium cellare ATCC 36951]KAF2163784.1 hypothetical protein M409DRAFT_25966 [Zasmidium cellare ATCC 36951]